MKNLKGVEQFAKKNKQYVYFGFRVLVGFLFAQHGAQKLFGLFGGNQAELLSLMGLAGIIEFFGGLLIALGLFTTFAVLIGSLDMIGAWVLMHIKNGWIPIANGGELALLYLIAFLLILSQGTGIWHVEKHLRILAKK